MPQDSFRSAVYRSFVKCDDPKGIAEYKTMRKSKTNSKNVEGVSETIIKTNDLNHSPPENTGKGKKKFDLKTINQQESVRTSSSHLKEVSKEAQKLNKVTDTYSNGMRFDRNSKEIAKDLLKGALDLQESLMMLSKLQEASHYMNKFRKKPKVKDDKKEEQAKMERSKSEKYAGYHDQMGFQRPRFSVDGSSRDCYDELRTVIRDSLARQNLLPPNFHDKKPDTPQGKILDSMVDIPSTSSTQSSTMNFISFTSSDNSFSSDSTKRSKGSNLIAKLMGLEGIPSPQGFISSPKRFEIETISGPKRPVFEIDTTKAKKPQLNTYKDGIEEEKRLKNIVETMRYKGLLKGKFSEEVSEQSMYSTSNNNKSKSALIEDSPPIVIMKPMDVSKAEPEENDSQKLVRKSKEMNRGAVDFDEVCRRLRGDNNIPMKIQGFREFKEKEISSKLKEKKKSVERADKVNITKKKLGENGNLKSKSASTSHDQVKVKEKKTEIEPLSRRRSVPLQKSNLSMVVSKNKPPLSQKRSDQKKNQKVDTDTEVVVDPFVDEDVECKSIEAQIHQSCEDECDITSTSSPTSAQLLAKEETKAHVQIKDRSGNKKLETIAESDEEASYLNSHTSTPNKFYENLTKEKKLFFSSPSFLNSANDLFDIEANSQLIQTQPTISNDHGIYDSRLLLDVANELMVHKKLTTQAVRPPFLTPPITLKASLPLTQLVDEVCKGIEDFSKYIENGNDKVITETIFSVLERDMFGIGSWESGWKHGYCFDEVEKVVGDIEKRIFNELIEDTLTGFSQFAF